MEASTLQAPAALPHTRVALATPLLRFRSDEQLVALFRAGHDDAFRVIHERYHKRLFAYTRQMLPARQDAEDALQDVFIRAYAGLRASDRELALRAWLFRVAHNRCIDELRRPAPPPPEVLELVRGATQDPLAEIDLRESLRRLIDDIRRLPEQQRSALLMRELAGMSYADLAASLGISVGAVKSLLVRARIGLAQATAARDTACGEIREHLVEMHDRGLRPDANARRHMRDCTSCKGFRRELRGVSRQLAAVAPAVGPLGVVAKLVGFSGGGGAGGGAALLGGGSAGASAGGVAVGVNHVATLVVAAVATAGGAVEIQRTIIAPSPRPAHVHRLGTSAVRSRRAAAGVSNTPGIQALARAVEATVSAAPTALPASSGTATPTRPRHKPLTRSDVAPPTKRIDSTTSSTTKTSARGSTTPGEKVSPSTASGTTCSPAASSGAASHPVSTGSSSTSVASTTSTSASDSQASAPVAAGACALSGDASATVTSSAPTTNGSGASSTAIAGTTGTTSVSSSSPAKPASDGGTSSSGTSTSAG